MPNLTTLFLRPIASELLVSVSGGCHGGGSASACSVVSPTVNFVMPQLGAQAPLTQTPQPDPNALAAASAPTGDIVKISVNTGTGTPTTTTA